MSVNNTKEEVYYQNKSLAEVQIQQVFRDWNHLKRCLVLMENEQSTKDERMTHQIDFHKTLLSCELRLRSLQNSIRNTETD